MNTEGSKDGSGAGERRAWGSLDRAHIVKTAVVLARGEGMAALTIRRLAAEVGASRMSLYRHIPDKDALLDLVADAVAESEVIPEEALSGPWQQRLRHLAHGMRRRLTAYPGLAELIVTRGNHGPGGLRLAETIVDILSEAGHDEPTTARYYLVFIDLVLGRAHREAAHREAAQGDPTTPQRNAPLLDAAAERRADAPRLAALAPHLRAVTHDQVFETELDILIQSLSVDHGKHG
ncbi:TetR/AcrR family transcriptional regulator [Streptomyces sp. NPDC059679]|uniref:TetR/AcrR family transcriptional regulator n=1 Tax=Streptomyces sp. NPDC059679 TaxID=3346903 RepID=UPI00368C125E